MILRNRQLKRISIAESKKIVGKANIGIYTPWVLDYVLENSDELICECDITYSYDPSSSTCDPECPVIHIP